jgi:hypothetical protein
MRAVKVKTHRSWVLVAVLALLNGALVVSPARGQFEDGCTGCSKCSGECIGGERVNCFCCSGVNVGSVAPAAEATSAQRAPTARAPSRTEV